MTKLNFFKTEKHLFLITFLVISFPFLFINTVKNLYSGHLNITPPPFFVNLNIPLLHFNSYCGLSILLIFTLIGFFFTDYFYPVFLFVLLYFLGHYESFMYFNANLFAIGTTLPFSFVLLSLPASQSTKKYLYWALPIALATAGLSKIHYSGLNWSSASNIGHILNYRYLLTSSNIPRYISQYPMLCMFLGVFTLIFELCGWILLLIFSHKRWLYGICALFFISGTFVVMVIDEFLPLYLPVLSLYFFNFKNERCI